MKQPSSGGCFIVLGVSPNSRFGLELSDLGLPHGVFFANMKGTYHPPYSARFFSVLNIQV